LREAEPRAAIFGLQTMDDAWDEFLGPEHLITDLPGLFGAASLLLAAIGLYAVAAFYTARRTREFGIRMALGSSPRRTVQEVLKEGLALAAVGVGNRFGAQRRRRQDLWKFLVWCDPGGHSEIRCGLRGRIRIAAEVRGGPGGRSSGLSRWKPIPEYLYQATEGLAGAPSR
jgi:hypothetical protein